MESYVIADRSEGIIWIISYFVAFNAYNIVLYYKIWRFIKNYFHYKTIA